MIVLGLSLSPTSILDRYRKKKQALINFEDLFKQANFNHILVSYSTQGLVIEKKGITSKFDTKFNTLKEYLEMSDFLQKKSQANSQNKYLSLENNTLYGNCDLSQLEGQFIKSFCFRFLTAIFAGGNDFK